jgi:hypothetical protein
LIGGWQIATYTIPGVGQTTLNQEISRSAGRRKKAASGTIPVPALSVATRLTIPNGRGLI